jgi:hypothetical protein
MRYGEGVSIPSQRRWVRYVELWSNKLGKQYKEGRVEILKIKFWGMKVDDRGDKIEVGIARFVDGPLPDSKVVENLHIFKESEVFPSPIYPQLISPTFLFTPPCLRANCRE